MAKKELKDEVQNTAIMDAQVPFDFDTFECKTLEDIKIWNLHAHKAFRDAKKLNPKANPPVPVKVADESYHKKAVIKFQRFDQPENVLKVHVRNKDIDWKGQLKPGCKYTLPLPVIRFLNNLSVPIFAEVKVENEGETRTETKQIGERNRFSCQFLEFEGE